MNTNVLAAVAALTLLISQPGCRTTGVAPGTLSMPQAGRLAVDMPRDAALNLLGPPEALATRLLMYEGDWKTHEVLRYRMPAGTNFFVVIFRDGKVTEYGPLVGERVADLEGLFENPGQPEGAGTPPAVTGGETH